MKKNKETTPKKIDIRKTVIKYIAITFGALLFSIAVSLFLDPNDLAPGGATGLAIIINRLIKVIPTGTLVLFINIPLLALGVWKFGFKFLVSTVYATSISSVFINLLAPYGPLTEDKLLAAVVGAVFFALSIGIIFKCGATTGGSDIIIKLVKLKYKHLETGKILMITDGIIIAASAFVFKNIDSALYAGLSLVISSFVLDLVLYGPDGAKLIYIISDKHEEIAKRLLYECDTGVTYINGNGAYTGNDKKILLCALKKQSLPQAQELVKTTDPNAFMIITSATEVYGENYKGYDSEVL